MTCAWIEDEIYIPVAQSIPRAFCFMPSIFADLETDPDSVNLVNDISNRYGSFSDLYFDDLSGCPGVKPPRFVVNTITGQELFTCDAKDARVADHTGSVVWNLVNMKRKSYRYRDVSTVLTDD